MLFIVSLIHNDILKEDRISLDVFSRPRACFQRPHSASKINPVGLFLILLKEAVEFAYLQAVSGRCFSCNGEVTVVLPFWKTFRI